ncbi:MAG TPA: SIMPL domain-containing protein, partial [Candidatus Nanoarchaeia archaeon]|nr:SIMPL domain-containing protein [Candidatus Nanoarchaeia archaeon]
MDKSVQITLIIVGAIIILALLGGSAFFQIFPGTGNTITSQGNSEIKVTPDLVTVYFTVDTDGITAKEAKDENAEIVDNLLTALIK